MKRFINIFLLAICLQFVVACNTNPDGSISLQPASLDLSPPEGPPVYQKGWSDGCESGANAYSNQFYKMVKAFDYKFDPKLRNNKMYYQVWKDAFLYCSLYWEKVNSGNI